MISRLLVILALGWGLSAWCEPLPSGHPEVVVKRDGQWRGLIGASLALTAGNANTVNALLNLDVARHTAHTKNAVQGFINHGASKVNGLRETTASNWGLSDQYDSDLSRQWFAFDKISFDGDRLVQLRLRSIVSVGLGYHLVDTQDNNTNLFGGLSYTDRRFSEVQTINGRMRRQVTSPGGLLGEESTQKINMHVTLKQRLEFYPDFTQDKAHTARFNGSLNVTLSRTLSLSLGLLGTYNHNTPPGVKKADATLFTGVNVTLE